MLLPLFKLTALKCIAIDLLSHLFSLRRFQLIFVLITGLLLQFPIHASNDTDFESAPLKFNHLTTADGLSQSYVFSIAQDEQGFMWIATQDGLDRYDGKTFVHYRHKSDDIHSLADNFVRKIYIDKDNTIWVGTENGLSRYNRELDNFDTFKNIIGNKSSLRDNLIWNIYQDNFNNLWVSTNLGIHKFDYKNNNFKQIRIRNFESKLQKVKTIFQDNKNNYWIGTYEKGIFLLNESLSYAVSLQEKNKWDINIPALGLYDIKTIENDYWLATDNGVFIVSDNYKIKKHLSKNDKNSLILFNKINAIEQINDTYVWLATENGLNSVNLLDYSVKKYQNSSQASSLSENWLNDIYKDKTGTIWLGTYGDGVNIYNPSSSIFVNALEKNGKNNFTVESLVETSKNTIWLSTAQGKYFSFRVNELTQSSALDIKSGISQFIKGDGDDIWIRSLDDKLFSYNIKNNKTIEHPQWAINSKHPVNNLLLLLENNIWYINEDGLLTSFNLISKGFTHYPLEQFFFTAIGTNTKELHAKNSSLWITSKTNDLYQFDLVNHDFKKFNIKNNGNFHNKQTKNVKVSNNWIWLGSHTQGITLINKLSLTVTNFDESNYLSNNFIADILIDENENAWFSTNKGITVIEPVSKKVKSFGEDFSIENNEFLAFSSLLSSTNTMFFGGTNGFYQFTPNEALLISQEIYKPIFTELFVANDRIKIVPVIDKNKTKDKEFTLNKQINYIKKLSLTYNQSPFSIEFKSPNSKLPSQLKYRFRLVGLDEDWIDADINYLRATYTNLSAGDYEFKVEVYDLYDPELKQSNSISIQIVPPWWSSKSALIIYGLLSLSFFAYLLQQVRHKRQYYHQIQQSEERLKLSLWGSGDEMWDWNIVTGKIFRSNIWGILEFPQDGTRNVGSDKTNLHQHDIPRVRQALDDHFDRKTDHFESTYRVKDKNDRWIWVLDRGKIVERNADDKPTRMTGTLKDISQIKKAEERLKLFAKCIENISDAVVIYDRQFITIDVNKSFQRITGKSKKQMLGQTLTFKQYPEKFSQNVKKNLINNGTWHGEIESKRDNGELYLTDLNIDVIRDENYNISHFVGVFSDITKRKETEIELRTLANSDTLTGLPNRSYFQANQSKLVKNKVPHALLVFDLDNFKKINDSLGHQVGDVLLCKVAQRILKVGRRQDTVYRLGGDEFSIIVENTNDIHTITTLAKTILKIIAQPLKLRNQEIVLYSSIGIVLYPEDGVTPHELLKNADTAMYHAKGLGGNKYQFFSESMNKKAVKRLQVESLIRHGLKEDLFCVYFQPKIEIATGKIAGMEALVRFDTPNKGLISPIVFIPIAEETGQIVDIGEVVLRKSCFATKKWVDEGLFDGRIAVNLSAVQFTQPNLVEIIASILIESNLPAKYLELEITEGTVMDSPQQAIETMLKIRDMGIHLSLDDFGTGYSSLAYLKKFPLNTLKIDKAFVDDIEHSEQGRNMVATIVTIAHNLGMHVVAEGVETTQQLSFLSGLKCEQLQGYLYSKPLKEMDFKKYLVAHKITDRSTTFNKL